MYAVIKAGGKQQKVKPGDVIEVEFVHGAGETVTFHPLLVVDDDGKTHYGKEAEKAVVTAKLVGEQKGDKVKIFKYKNKTGYARRQGHRQLMTLLEIAEVSLGAAAPKKPSATKPAVKAEGDTSTEAAQSEGEAAPSEGEAAPSEGEAAPSEGEGAEE
ncbi:MAG: 50S ribosomal protein L21 [Actinomycetota bacterium]